MTPLGPRNRLLALLPSDLVDRLAPVLEPVVLKAKTFVYEGGNALEHLHFVDEGIVSIVALTQDGTAIEVGLVGPEGVVGASLLMGTVPRNVAGLVQFSGTARRVKVAAFKTIFDEEPALRDALLRYGQSLFTQIVQSIVCNRFHPLEERCARWLLMAHDRIEGDALPLTHEFLATMLGVRRAGVTIALGVLQSAGLIRSTRGNIAILDRSGLEAAVCECYEVVNAESRRLIGWPADEPLIGRAPHEEKRRGALR